MLRGRGTHFFGIRQPVVCGTAVALDPEGSPGQVSLALEEEKLSYPHIKLLSSGVTTIQLVVVVQSLHRVRLFATPWATARQALLSFTISGVCSNNSSAKVKITSVL